MCCIRIDTDVVLANVFAIRDEPISVNDLSKYVDFMYSHTPIYVITDFCERALKNAVDTYPDLYTIKKDEDGDFVMLAGKQIPNLEFFNSRYSEAWASYIQRSTKFYFDSQMIKD